MKKVYTAHPLMILSFIKPFLFVLFLPIIKGIIHYFTNRTITGVIIFEILLLAIVFIIAVLKCRAFRLIIEEDNVTVKTGFVFVKQATIKASQLSSVESRQNPLDAVFRSVTYSINTEAGRKNRADFKFKLSVKNSREISGILYGTKETQRVKFSVFKIAILAATTSSAFTGIIIGVPIINKAGDLFGIGLSKMLFDEINNVSNKFSLYFPPIVNVISLIFLLAYVVSFVYSFLKYINFRLRLNDEKLEVRSGFFVRSRNSFKRSSVNDVRIEQTPLMLLFGRYAMKVSVGGYGDSKSESEVLVPSAKLTEINQELKEYFPMLKVKGRVTKAPRTAFTKSRFLFLPSVFLIIVLALSITLALIFKDFGRLILFISLLSLIAVFYYAYISLRIYKHGKIIFGETMFAHSIKGLRICKLYCPKQNVGQIKITRFFTDFSQNTCRVKITVRSESADRIRIKMLDDGRVKEEINNCYGIEV